MNVPGVRDFPREHLQGKTLLVAGEQGHGDMMTLARYIPKVEQMVRDR